MPPRVGAGGVSPSALDVAGRVGARRWRGRSKPPGPGRQLRTAISEASDSGLASARSRSRASSARAGPVSPRARCCCSSSVVAPPSTHRVRRLDVPVDRPDSMAKPARHTAATDQLPHAGGLTYLKPPYSAATLRGGRAGTSIQGPGVCRLARPATNPRPPRRHFLTLCVSRFRGQNPASLPPTMDGVAAPRVTAVLQRSLNQD